MPKVTIAAGFALLAAAATATATAQTGEPIETRRPISFSQLLNQPRETADHRIPYGEGPLQFGELWLPPTGTSHPVIVLIHGGCWLASLPGIELMDYMAADLRARGYAVWNLEYRRLGNAGGGYPGTFQDVAAGIDYLRTLAPQYNLDLDRVVLSGHSAGGHLALWAAARDRLPASSPLGGGDPLPVRGVVGLAAIADLAAYRDAGPLACGGPPTIDRLIGAPAPGRDLYADTSPAALLPLGDRQILISGALDPIVPARFGQAYAAAAAARGDPATSIVLGGAGHFELIDPTSAVWPRILAAYAELVR